METREDTVARIQSVAELLGMTPEQLVAAAATAQNSIELLEPDEDDQKPPPIVYPNLKYPRYKFREYPKILYRGYIRDIEEPLIKFVSDGNGGMKQINAVRVIPDQFVMETMTVNNKLEEMARPKGWFLTLEEAKKVAADAKAATRPILERIVETKPEAPAHATRPSEERDEPITVAPKRRKRK